MLAQMSAAGRERSVEITSTRGVRVRLFCFPYAGGSASAFRPWLRAFPAEIQVLPVHLPGRERRFRETGQTQLEPLVMSLYQEFTQYSDVPFALFGHSMGAAIAYELARLEWAGRLPVYLFVSGRRAPQRPPDPEMIHELPDDELMAKLRELQGTPDEVLRNPEIMALMLPIIRADFTLSETYRYREGPLLTCPVSAFGGAGDPRVAHDDLLAWREQTRGAFRWRIFPGGHFFLHESQANVLKAVTDDLSQVVLGL